MRYLVTGATGFVGGALANALLARGADVLIAGRRPSQELLQRGAAFFPFDLEKPPSAHLLAASLVGVDGVFHAAAKVRMWGQESEFVQANVQSTVALLNACRAAGVKRLVYTSSPSVIANGQDLLGVDESQPYPSHFEAAYPKTKALAEQAVLAANGQELWTAALRPHLIFGRGDTNLVPTILARARAGRLVRIGAGENVADFTYIDDCVQAHILAMEGLERPECRGKAYFISQGDPFPLWRFIDEVLSRSELPALSRRVPVWLALAIASMAERWGKMRNSEPFLSAFLVKEMSTSHYFNISRARTLLRYRPTVTVEEGLVRTFSPAIA